MTSLLGSFGAEVREVRITATLGYLIARDPKPFCEFFEFRGDPMEVHLERPDSSGGRTDIIVRTNRGDGLIEAKIDGTDASQQAESYSAKWKVVLSDYIPSVTKRRPKTPIVYRNWNALAAVLYKLEKSHDREIAVVSKHLLQYLCDSNMSTSKADESKEIYARDLNTLETFNMFVFAHIYGCEADRSPIRRTARYFAPYIASGLAAEQPSIGEGFTYVARIVGSVVVDDLETMLKACRQELKGRYRRHEEVVKEAGSRFDWSKSQNLLFLGPPRRAFWPPIHKTAFQKTPGNLSNLSFTFDELFAVREAPLAWPAKAKKAATSS